MESISVEHLCNFCGGHNLLKPSSFLPTFRICVDCAEKHVEADKETWKLYRRIPDGDVLSRFEFLREWQRFLAPRGDRPEYRKLLLIVNKRVNRLMDRYDFFGNE